MDSTDHLINDERSHEVVLKNRESVTATGIMEVESFDDREIVLVTDLGTMVLRGEDLHIEKISLDSGDFTCTGLITGLQYSAGAASGRRGEGLLGRLFH
ncbi:MAG: sporulation protein YabP [Bacillota bacterium]|jgi:sporulation protein YabP